MMLWPSHFSMMDIVTLLPLTKLWLQFWTQKNFCWWLRRNMCNPPPNPGTLSWTSWRLEFGLSKISWKQEGHELWVHGSLTHRGNCKGATGTTREPQDHKETAREPWELQGNHKGSTGTTREPQGELQWDTSWVWNCGSLVVPAVPMVPLQFLWFPCSSWGSHQFPIKIPQNLPKIQWIHTK